ncbi:MAG: 2-dehydropantoate 2-reductase, partial [Proteobacteria bacterium]|nr:2-dehydropantoate 2-reductase [Pseudomonadota bacterium]
TTKFDIVFIATKSYDTDWAARTMQPYLAPDGFVVSLQNGINEPAISDIVGAACTVGCIASMISVELMSPGLIQRNVKLGGADHTVFRAGEQDGSASPRIAAVAEMLSSVDSAKVTGELMVERWSKLAVNCMRNPLGAATGRGTNANDSDPDTRRLAIRLAAEAAAVGIAEVGRLEKISGIAPEQLLAAGKGDAQAMQAAEQILVEAMARRSDNQRPSMAQDVAKGRPTEIDYINGLVVERARKRGIQVPANDGIVRVIKMIEAGAVDPCPAAVAGL